MILRHMYKCVLRGRGGGCWGVLRPTPPPPTPRLMSSCCGRSRGVGEVPGLRDGRKNCLHTDSLSCSAFTWSRRKRRREMEGLLSVSCPCYCTDFSGSTGGVEEVKDDEAQPVLVMERGGDGEFHDSQYHYHHSIKEEDVGVKVNVGEPVICELQRLFHIPRENALKMVRSDDFLLVSDKTILQTLYFLKDHQITPEQLQRIPWILLQPADLLQQKFEGLQDPHLFLSLTDGLGFCYFSNRDISRFQRGFVKEAARFPDHPNRVYYLAERMEIPVPVVTEKVVRPRQVLRMNINKMNHTLDVFNKYGVHMKHVLSDMWVFCHNIQVSEDRLRQAVEAGCANPKPWICHASVPVFERYLERLKSKRLVLGEDGDLETYLSERLHCPVYEVQAAFRRNKSLRRVHVSHIKTKLDILFDAGFTTEDVRSCIRVLQYSEGRTRKRIEEMKSLGESSFPISILFKQPKTYFNILWKIKKAKREEKEERMKMMREEEEEVIEGKNEKEGSEGRGG